MLTQEVCLETHPRLAAALMTNADNRPAILYVDDSPKSRRLLTSILRDAGFTVCGVGSVFEALLAAHRQRFDLALLDYTIPHVNGAQLARKLNKIQSDLPTVVIAGMQALPPHEMCLIDAYVGRGATLDDLLSAIRILLREGRTMTAGCAVSSWNAAGELRGMGA